MRVLAIWITGIVAFGITGTMIAWTVDHHRTTVLMGGVAGVCLFTCLRLWFANVGNKP